MNTLLKGLLALLLMVIAGACGVAPQLETEATQTSAGNSAAAAPPAGQITLRVATGDSGAGLIPHQEIIAAFEAENPAITVVLESAAGPDYYSRLLTNIAAGNAPDIVQIGDDALPKFVAAEALVPLDHLADETYPLEQDIYLPGLLEPGRWQGQQYLLPKDYSTLAVFYNKKIFDASQVAYPQAGWTWDDFLETAQALTQDRDGDGETDVWGVQLPASWTTGFEYWVAAADGRLISEEGRQFVGYMDSAATAEAVQFYADLYNRYQVAPLPADLNTFGGGNDQFAKGQAAMHFFGRWPQASFLANPEIEVGLVEPPRHKAEANILIWSGFGIARASRHQEAAWRFLRFYTGRPGAEVWREWALPAVEPVAQEAGLTEDPLESVWLDQLENLVPRGYTFTPVWDQTAEPALRRVLESVIIDPQADVAITLQRAAREAQNRLEALE